jgi:carboxynorspermidine decarboxylase
MILETPYYLLEESKLRKNLELLKYVKDSSEAKILLALKGFAFSGAFEMMSEYLDGCCASGLYEARYSKQMMGLETHTYSPAFKDDEIDEIISISNHLVFNSFSQWQKYKEKTKGKVSCGLRVNPEVSASPKDIYNPCSTYSRLGITKKEFRDSELDGIEGLHFHALCEQGADELEMVLEGFEKRFGYLLKDMKWVNFGGGHHITKEGYDIEKLIKLIKEFKAKYDVSVYLEPGEAVGWQTGTLVSTVLDIVHNEIDIAILDTSAEAHMPDTIIMPYRSEVRGTGEVEDKKYRYRLAGNTCLAGDIMGDYSFDKPLKIGDKVIFEDQIHYTIVKNTTFNGIKLPNLALIRENGDIEIVKEFGYDEYKDRN